MDELLTDLRWYDKHKAFRRGAKAGGRLQGKTEAERSSKLWWAEDVQAKAGSSGFGCEGKGRPSRGGCVEERVPIMAQGALGVLGCWGRRMRRKEAKLSVGSSAEAGSGAALGGDHVVGSR